MAGRGARPGERRGGRKAGTLNKVTADIKALAQSYAPRAVEELAHLALTAQSEQARIAAIKEILDRAYGKSHTTAEVSTPRNVRDLSTADLLRVLAACGVVSEEHSDEQPERLH